MSPRFVFLIVVGAFILGSWTSDESIGASSACRDADCVVSASSSLLSIIIAIGLLLFLVFYRQIACTVDSSKVVGVWRRFGAFFLDFALVMLIVSPVAALPLLVAEANYTNAFQWSFHRQFARPTDVMYLMPAIVAAFLALFFYFYQHARVGRQTIGQYVLAYKVTMSASAARAPNWALRVILSFCGLCMWPISVVLALRTSQKIFWWDSVTGSSVVRVLAANNRIERPREP
jgi:hypothetical protein